MSNHKILVLTDNIFGNSNGTFPGDTFLDGATVNPGNSLSLLTLNGDVNTHNVNWVMEYGVLKEVMKVWVPHVTLLWVAVCQ